MVASGSKSAYGGRTVVIDYVMPGFALAQKCLREFPAQRSDETVGMVLMNHGVFSFGDTARESYERMIELVSDAEEYLARTRRGVERDAADRTPCPSPGPHRRASA